MLLKKLESIKSTGKHWIKYLSTDEKKELLTKVPHLNIEINGVGEFMCCLREGISKQVVCIACGGPTKYNPAKKTYSPFCSTDCRWSDKGKAHSQKVKEKSNLEKYGVKNVNQLGDVKDLKKKRSLEKYGTEHPNQHKDIREKISESRKGSRGETYKRLVDENGGEHPRCPVCGTSLEFNSGKCEFYTFCSEECKTSPEGKAYSKAIRDSTNMERYGTTIPGQRKEAKIKRKKTNLERYGSECVFGNDEIKERLAKTQRNNFWDTFIILLEQKKVQPLFTKEDYIEGSTSKKKYKCLMCNSNFSTGAVHPQNIYCTCHSNRSLKEEEVAGWIESLGIDIQRNFRIGKKEIDMYLPKYNLGIEFNGIYWHSEAYRGEYYHQDKYKLCLEHAIGLIQIFENEWEFKRDIVKSLVLSRLGILPKVLYARKCIIKELDNSTYKKFVIKNHLQEYAPATIKLGLYYDEELVQIMSFSKPRYTSEYNWENIRTCTKINTSVVGGFSKLLKHFGQSNIVSYVDTRYFTGEGYLKNGFTKKSLAAPNYFYFKDNSLILESRLKYQKHKLKDLLDEFDPEKSEKENMRANRFRIIYDAGNLVMVKGS